MRLHALSLMFMVAPEPYYTKIMTIPTTYVNWHCTNCGHENETNRKSYSYPATCPSCGEKSIRHGHPVLPTNRVYCDSEPRRYSFTSSDEEIQVYMISITGKRCGVVLDPDNVPDCDNDPIEVAKEVLSILNRHIYTSSKERVEVVLNDMIAHKEESEKNAVLNRIHELRESIVHDVLEYEELSA